MPNVIKYSTGATPTGCLRKGNMLIGNNTADYGLTFFNGIDPPSGGYTIYLNKASGGPSIYCPANDTQLIFITNQIAGANYTTAAQCFDYYNSQTDKVCVTQNYPTDFPFIVLDGLVLYLDAGVTTSYPGTGTTWTDVNGLGTINNGTLINGPTFSSANSGSIVFDGTNDYVQVNNTTTASFTLGCWISTTATGQGNPGSQAYEGSGIIWSDVGGVGNDFVLAMTGNVIAWFTGNPDSSINDTSPINTGAWFYLTATKNGTSGIKSLYVNGILKTSGSCNANVLNANPKINIGGNTLDNRYFNGKISQVGIYNKVLSQAEITQNYNALKGRYGL